MQFMVAAAASAVICVIVTGDTLVIWPVGLALFILYYTFLKR
jgi:hypothetical protein